MLKSTIKNKAILLDRDWTINQDLSYVYKLSDLKLLDGVKEGLLELKNLWYKLIIITNQSWIWRWYFTMDDCVKFNTEIEKRIWFSFDGIYICPHTPDDHCTCRKPGTGLLEKAIEDFDLDISQCYFVGDKESDIQAGISAGCKTVWIENNLHPCTVKSDFIVTSLKQFSEILSSLPIN